MEKPCINNVILSYLIFYMFWKSAAILQIFSVLSCKYYLEGPGTGKCGQMLQKFPGIPVKERREYLRRY